MELWIVIGRQAEQDYAISFICYVSLQCSTTKIFSWVVIRLVGNGIG